MTNMLLSLRPAGLWAAGLMMATAIASAKDQPQWGQAWSRNMVSAEKGLPDTFDPKTGKHIKWSARLGTETHATPVIANGRVLIGTNNGEPRDPKHKGDLGVLMCLAEKDGAFLWQLVIPKREGDIYLDWPNSGMCSPATVEGNRVYILNNRGVVMCLDLEGMANGNDGPVRNEGVYSAPKGGTPQEPGPTDADIIWTFDLVSGAGIYSHDSAHASILIHGPYLYLNSCNGVDNTHKRIRAPEAPSLVVLDKATGQLVAKDDERIGPRIFHCTWSSPALGEVNGRPLIFFGGGDGVVYAFEPVGGTAAAPKAEILSGQATPPANGASPVATLKRVWRFDCDPAAPKENVHLYNGNRRESPSNIKSTPVFDHQRIYVTVGGDLWWGKHEAWLKCLDATKTGDITKTGELWSYPLERHCMSTPAVDNGLVFIADCGRKVHCVEAQTGRPCWTHEAKGDIWASTLVADGKVYIGSRRGEFLVFAADKEKRVVGTVELGESMNSSPVAANGTLYVTTMRHLYAVKLESQ